MKSEACGVRPEIKSQYYVLPWHVVKLRGLRMQDPHPTLLPNQTVLLIKGTSTIPANPWAAGLSFLPYCRIIQPNQPYPPMETKEHLTLLLLQRLFTLFPSPTLCDPVWHIVSSSSKPWVCMTKKLMLNSSV